MFCKKCLEETIRIIVLQLKNSYYFHTKQLKLVNVLNKNFYCKKIVNLLKHFISGYAIKKENSILYIKMHFILRLYLNSINPFNLLYLGQHSYEILSFSKFTNRHSIFKVTFK